MIHAESTGECSTLYFLPCICSTTYTDPWAECFHSSFSMLIGFLPHKMSNINANLLWRYLPRFVCLLFCALKPSLILENVTYWGWHKCYASTHALHERLKCVTISFYYDFTMFTLAGGRLQPVSKHIAIGWLNPSLTLRVLDNAIRLVHSQRW